MKKLLSVTFLLTCGLLSTACDQKNNTELSDFPKNGMCSIDIPANNTQLSATEDFQIGGWAFDKTTNSTTDALTIYFKNTKTNELISVAAKIGHNRPDVAKALNIPSIENSGFNAVIEKGKLIKGDYEIILIQKNKNRISVSCENIQHMIKII